MVREARNEGFTIHTAQIVILTELFSNEACGPFNHGGGNEITRTLGVLSNVDRTQLTSPAVDMREQVPMDGTQLDEIPSGSRLSSIKPQGTNRYEVTLDRIEPSLSCCADKVFQNPSCGIPLAEST